MSRGGSHAAKTKILADDRLPGAAGARERRRAYRSSNAGSFFATATFRSVAYTGSPFA
jgi:hypothetical protein